MPDYIKIEFEFLSDEQKAIVVAILSEMGYEGFEEEGDLLSAYISSPLYDENELRNFGNVHRFSFSVTKIESKNWNQEWESNFHPVTINHAVDHSPFVGIRADFHEPLNNVKYEIIITPKMSFGTGHHATTIMMIKMMSELDFTGKKVLDFGTGTGILAILSEKLGATEIVAIDNDDQSIENSAENFKSNNCKRISLLRATLAKGDGKFDIILANIIKVVILENLPLLVGRLNLSGLVLFSGLLKTDEREILTTANANNLYLDKKLEMDDWMCLVMRYKPNTK